MTLEEIIQRLEIMRDQCNTYGDRYKLYCLAITTLARVPESQDGMKYYD